MFRPPWRSIVRPNQWIITEVKQRLTRGQFHGPRRTLMKTHLRDSACSSSEGGTCPSQGRNLGNTGQSAKSDELAHMTSEKFLDVLEDADGGGLHQIWRSDPNHSSFSWGTVNIFQIRASERVSSLSFWRFHHDRVEDAFSGRGVAWYLSKHVSSSSCS